MGDRRGKKIRTRRGSEFSSKEDIVEEGMKMGRTKHTETAGASSKDSGTRDQKRKHPKERWLLTRKTWRYMADAGRRLIPDGALNRPEDVPKIESYFQQVCSKEPRFLLWRKSSYPGALGFRSHHRKNRSRKKGGSCREKASSADEADLFIPKPTTSGRFDLQRLKQEFLYGSNVDSPHRHKSFLPNVPEASATFPEEEEETEEDEDAKNERELMDSLSKYLHLQEHSDEYQNDQESNQLKVEAEENQVDYQKLVDQLRSYLSRTNIFESEKESESSSNEATFGTKERKNQQQKPKYEQQQQQENKQQKQTNGQQRQTNEQQLQTNEQQQQTNEQQQQTNERQLQKNEQQRQKHETQSQKNRQLEQKSQQQLHKNIQQQKLQQQRKQKHEQQKQQKYQEQQRNQKKEHQEDSSTSNIRTTTYRPLTPSPSPSRQSFEFGTPERMTLETLKRYYSKSTCRQKVITDLLTDRKLLEKLYSDIRKARNSKSDRKGPGYVFTSMSPTSTPPSLRSIKDSSTVYKGDKENDIKRESESWSSVSKPSQKQQRPTSLLLSPPPLIEIYSDYEQNRVNVGIQTDPIPASVLVAIQMELKKPKTNVIPAEEPQETKIEVLSAPSPKRRSSVDNDDVSPSVSDTIKRYLRMARKKSLDSEKVDRFKRVNYDRNLRNIKPKTIPMPGDNDGLNKGCQTDESWVIALKELKLEDPCSDTEIMSGDEVSGSLITSSRSSLDGAGVSDDALLSPPSLKQSSGILSSGQSFLSSLLHGLQQQQQSSENIQSVGSAAASVGGTMQKSKSSSSVVQQGSRLVAKNIWRRTRSKSQSRASASATSTWTPQGNCAWSNVTGRQVTLGDCNLLTLSEVERRLLQKVALAKLQALNLGVTIRVPSESVVSMSHKTKRRPYLLKRKALTTGFFDANRGKDDKDKENGGLVFGIPIGQCLENDRLTRLQHGGSPSRDEPSELRRKSHHGSRTSCSSLIETSIHGDDRGSCESLMSPPERMAGSVPGLLDTISCSSTTDITGDRDPSIPQLVQACFRHLENFGLHTLGIFRVSSSKKRVRQLREDFDCGKDIMLGEDHCPHDVATLLKEFFRDLPEPLLCRDLYHAFVQTQ
ncbi:hypothetical protein L9F63_016263, partial [Diploptera punctata]